MCLQLLAIDTGDSPRVSGGHGDHRGHRRGQGRKTSTTSLPQSSMATDVMHHHTVHDLDALTVADLHPVTEDLTAEVVYALEFLEKMGDSKPGSKESLYNVLLPQMKFMYFTSLAGLLKSNRKISKSILTIEDTRQELMNRKCGTKRKREMSVDGADQREEFLALGFRKVCTQMFVDRKHFLDNNETMTQGSHPQESSSVQGKVEVPCKRSRGVLSRRGRGRGACRTDSPHNILAHGIAERVTGTQTTRSDPKVQYQNILLKQVLWKAQKENACVQKADVEQTQSMKTELQQFIQKLRENQAGRDEQMDTDSAAFSEHADETKPTNVMSPQAQKLATSRKELTKMELMALLIKQCMKSVTYKAECLAELLEQHGLVQYEEMDDENGECRGRVVYSLEKFEPQTLDPV